MLHFQFFHIRYHLILLTDFLQKGRTARIGNEGIATSFYNERDEDLAPELVKILMECQQEVPDFLQEFAPSDNVLVFDDETDNEAEMNDDGSAWREYGQPETTIIEASPQGEQSEPGLKQSVSTSESQWTEKGTTQQRQE